MQMRKRASMHSHRISALPNTFVHVTTLFSAFFPMLTEYNYVSLSKKNMCRNICKKESETHKSIRHRTVQPDSVSPGHCRSQSS